VRSSAQGSSGTGLTSQDLLCKTPSGGIIVRETAPNKPGTVLYIPPDELIKGSIVDEGVSAIPVASLAPLASSSCSPVPSSDESLCAFSYQVLTIERPSSDGDNNNFQWNAPIQSILILPTSDASGKLPPMIVLPHGGPHTASTAGYVPELAYLCGQAGYALLLVNYRGSLGFGQSAVEDLPGRIGDLDVNDVVHAASHVAGLGLVDPDKLFICGGSHGGFLAGHLIGQFPDLFKAACMRNPVTNIASMLTSTDIPDWCVIEGCGLGTYDYGKCTGPTAEQLIEMYRKSPVAHVQNVKVPTLVALGTKDLRVPPSQGLEFYYILRSRGVITKLLLYDDCDHPIGAVCSKADHWLNIKRWFDEHMPGSTSSSSASPPPSDTPETSSPPSNSKTSSSPSTPSATSSSSPSEAPSSQPPSTAPSKTASSNSPSNLSSSLSPSSPSQTSQYYLGATTTIASLPSFQDADPLVALMAGLETIVQPLVAVLSISLLLAVGMVAWEDYGAANLWPSRLMIVETSNLSKARTGAKASFTSLEDAKELHSTGFGIRTIHGLAFGREQRLSLLQEENENKMDFANTPSPLLPEIRAFNEVMKEHREKRLPRWQEVIFDATGKQAQRASSQASLPSEMKMKNAVEDLREVLLQVLEMQKLVADYQWDTVHNAIQASVLPKLEPAATALRQQMQLRLQEKDVTYEEIGFDWGSCAWRHCGALADAQEALDELDHLLGVLEPPECLFCLNVVERSIRDMLAVVPAKYHAVDGIPAYIQYHSALISSADGDDEFGDVLDQEYLKMLQELRNTASADDE